MKLSRVLVFMPFFLMNLYGDVVFVDDSITQGSSCIGQDCVNGESFGFDTLVLKENNLRIKFNDTSSSSNFPNEDWEIVINDTVNGGEEYFAIRNATTDTTLFKIGHDGTVSMGSALASTFNLSTGGDLTVSGTVSDSSDMHLKEFITPINGKEILNKLMALPISTWNYKTNKNRDKHIGSMAQDFYKLFKFGPDNKHIAPKDVGFVAVAGVQELKKELEVKDKKILKLEKEIAELAKAVKALQK